LQTYPALQGILLDLPAVADSAHAVLQAAVSAGRCQIVGGDFLTAVPPGGDVYILKRILVDRDDARAPTRSWPIVGQPWDHRAAYWWGGPGPHVALRGMLRYVDAGRVWERESDPNGSRVTGPLSACRVHADPDTGHVLHAAPRGRRTGVAEAQVTARDTGPAEYQVRLLLQGVCWYDQSSLKHIGVCMSYRVGRRRKGWLSQNRCLMRRWWCAGGVISQLILSGGQARTQVVSPACPLSVRLECPWQSWP
jgi:hypothetical protein